MRAWIAAGLAAVWLGWTALAGATVRVAVIGDYGEESPGADAVANLVHGMNADIVITLGDNSYDGHDIDDNVGQYYSRYIGNYGGDYPPGSTVNRFFPSLGNHDYSDGDGLPAYLAYFTLPGAGIPSTHASGNERYYDFIRGPIHFFALNSNEEEPDGIDSTSVQAQWLRTRLAASTSPWKIVYMHHSPYSSGDSHGSIEIMQWPFRAWGASAVLSGHDHVYERFLIDGIPYFVNGIGGRNLKGFRSPRPGSVVRYNDDFGAMLLTVENGDLTFQLFSIASTDSLVDSFTLVGGDPELSAAPAAFGFGSHFVGAMAMQGLVLRNVGTGELEITSLDVVGPDASEFDVIPPAAVRPRRSPENIIASAWPLTLAPGDSTTMLVQFDPETPGTKNASLHVVSNDSDQETLVLPLVGFAMQPFAPALELRPAALDFGTIPVFTNGRRSVFWCNRGSEPLEVQEIVLLGPEMAHFALTCPTGTFQIAAGDSVENQVTFAPTSLGTKTASLRMTSNDPAGQFASVALTGRAIPPLQPHLAVSPSALEFGGVAVSDRASSTLRMHNTGGAALQVSSVSLVGADVLHFAVTNGGGSHSILPGDSVVVTLAFEPSTQGAKSAALRIASNDPEQTVVDIPLTGLGLPPPAPDIFFAPAGIDFGEIIVSENASAIVRIHNQGLINLHLLAVALTGANASQFSILSGGEARTVGVGDSTSVVVRFLPTTTGTKVAALRITSDDPDAAVVDIVCTGVGIPPPAPDIDVVPMVADFGGVFVTTGSATQSVTIRNEGNATLDIGSTTILGTDATSFTLTSGGAPLTLSPGASATLSLGFAPATSGTKTATLRIQSNDPDEATWNVVLSGIGIVPPGTRLDVTFQSSVDGKSTNSVTVTSSSVAAVSSALYLAAITTKDHVAVQSVTGMGLTWTLVRAQCSGRGQTGVEIWSGTGTASPGTVTARFVSTPNSAALVVARYVGTDPVAPLGALVSANTNGVQGGCTGGADTASHSTNLLTTVPGATVFAGVAIRNRDYTRGSGYTLRDDVTAGSGGWIAGLAVMDRSVANPSQTAVNGTFSQAIDWAVVAVELKPAIVFPEITVTPMSSNFGTLEIGQNASRSFEIRNDGAANLSVQGIGVFGSQAPEFAITSGGTPPTLAPGGRHTVTVRFAPEFAGAKSAVLRIVSNDANELTTDVALAGTAILRLPEVVVTPSALDFGSVHVLGSVTRNIRVANTGDASLQVSAIAVTGADSLEFTLGTSAPFTVSPGDSTNIVLTWVPLAQGSSTATLRVSCNDPDEPVVTVALAGIGLPPLAPDLDIDPVAIDFGSLALLASTTRTVRLANAGSGTLHVASLQLVGADSLAFALPGGAGPLVLAAGASTILSVYFSPTSPGAKNAALRITSDDPDENPLSVPLTGLATVPLEGAVVFEGAIHGTATSGTTVTTSSSLQAEMGEVVLAAVTSKGYVNVTALSGCGLTWTPVRAQCGGRLQTGVQIWKGTGTPSPGAVTATFASAPSSAVLIVARYSGADPATAVGAIVSANTNGTNGACSGGTDNAAYALSLPTSVDDAAVFTVVAMRSRVLVPGQGNVVRDALTAGGSGAVSGLTIMAREVETPATVSVNGTFDGAVDWAVVAIELRPFTGAAKQVQELDRVMESGLTLGHGIGRVPWIELASPRPARAHLRIFDVRGRWLQTLWDGPLPAGRTRLEWGARDASRPVPAGVYFVHAEIGGQRFVRKILNVR